MTRHPTSKLLALAAPVSVIVVCVAAALTTGCEPTAYATIGSPKSDSTYVAGDTIWFQGEVNSNDPIGIISDGDWVWTSDLDGELGATPLFVRTDLSRGEHLITLRVRNSAGLLLRDQARIFVR
jgi:hypothetical protein